MNPQETFVCRYSFGDGTDVIVVVRCADFTVFAAASRAALVYELPAHQRIYFADDCGLAHAERLSDGVCAWPALAFLTSAGNQTGVDLELVWIQALGEDVVVKGKVGHEFFLLPLLYHTCEYFAMSSFSCFVVNLYLIRMCQENSLWGLLVPKICDKMDIKSKASAIATPIA